MSNSIKGENKLEGASNFRSWNKRIDLILEKNKVLDSVKGNVKMSTEEASDADKAKLRDLELVAMTLMVEGIKYNLVQFIVNINQALEMYEAFSNLFTIKNIDQVACLKNELRNMKMNKEDVVETLFVKITRLRDDSFAINEIIPDK